MNKHVPPRLARSLLARVLRDDVPGRTIGADLDEEFACRAERHGRAAARRWYWRAVAGMSLGFTTAALITLMVGIGSSTAIFSVLNAVVLRPLPYAEPERLMFLSEAGTDGRTMTISWPNFQDWKREVKSFDAIAGVGAAT